MAHGLHGAGLQTGSRASHPARKGSSPWFTQDLEGERREDEAGQLLRNYLATIQQETPPGPFSRHLIRVIPNPDRQLTSHLRKWR